MKRKKPRTRDFTEEDARKISVFSAMARCISENWPEWELIANVPGYSPEPDGMAPIRDIGVFKCGKIMGTRLVLPDSDAVSLLKEICGAFVAAKEREEEGKCDALEKRQETAVHGQQ